MNSDSHADRHPPKGTDPGHVYLSTACGHGVHAKCRLVCKYCDSGCACECHRPVSVHLDFTKLLEQLEQLADKYCDTQASPDNWDQLTKPSSQRNLSPRRKTKMSQKPELSDDIASVVATCHKDGHRLDIELSENRTGQRRNKAVPILFCGNCDWDTENLNDIDLPWITPEQIVQIADGVDWASLDYGHKTQDAIWLYVIQQIAKGHPNPAGIAQAAQELAHKNTKRYYG